MSMAVQTHQTIYSHTRSLLRSSSNGLVLCQEAKDKNMLQEQTQKESELKSANLASGYYLSFASSVPPSLI